jgi:hypothetical protein
MARPPPQYPATRRLPAAWLGVPSTTRPLGAQEFVPAGNERSGPRTPVKPDIATIQPRKRLTTPALRLESTHFGTVNGNFTLQVLARLVSEVPVSQQRRREEDRSAGGSDGSILIADTCLHPRKVRQVTQLVRHAHKRLGRRR